MNPQPLPLSPERMIPDWARELPVAITVCDMDAIILYMNDKSTSTFSQRGGEELIGKSLYDCHSAYSAAIIRDLLANGRSNTYTVEKNGVKKLICQTPWYQARKLAGLVELSIVLPENMPHFIRQ